MTGTSYNGPPYSIPQKNYQQVSSLCNGRETGRFQISNLVVTAWLRPVEMNIRTSRLRVEERP
jgi:hypothetical protein